MSESTGPACGISPAPPPGVDPLSYQVFLSFMTALHAHRQLMFKILAETGGHPGQAGALRQLAANDGMSQRDLAQNMHLSRPTVTVMLKAMEAHDVVERRVDEKDQRITRVFLTEKGRTLAEQAQEGIASYINTSIGALSEKDRRELDRLLGELAKNTTKALEE